MVRRRRAWTRSSPSDNGIRADTSLEALAAAPAGVRPAVRHGHRRATRRRSPTARRPCCSWREEKARGARATSRSPTSGATPSPRSIRAGSCSWARCYAVPRGARARRASRWTTWAWSRSTRRSRRRCSATCRPGARTPGPSGSGCAGPVGEVDWERTNVMGGSIAIGHPFGATGARLVTTLANEMRAARRAVRADHDLRAGRHGLRAWSWSATMMSRAHHATHRRRHRGRHVRPARRAGQQAQRARSRSSSRRCSIRLARRHGDPRRRADLGQAGQLHRRRRHRGVHRARPPRPTAERLSFEGQEMVSRVETLRASRSSPPSTAPASAAGSSSRSPATTASPPTIPRPSSACPRCSSASFPAPAAPSGCPG